MSYIYVIVCGEYSSKSILGATTDFERAKELVLEDNREYDTPRIMVYEDSAKLEYFSDKEIYVKYWVKVEDNGEVTDVTYERDTSLMYDDKYNETNYYSCENGYYAVVSNTIEGAIKSAKDKWVIDKSLKEGI